MSRVYEIVRGLVLSFVDGFLVAGILGRGLVALSSPQGESCMRLFGFGSPSRADGCVSS